MAEAITFAHQELNSGQRTDMGPTNNGKYKHIQMQKF